jgi:hypothetical protein
VAASNANACARKDDERSLMKRALQGLFLGVLMKCLTFLNNLFVVFHTCTADVFGFFSQPIFSLPGGILVPV